MVFAFFSVAGNFLQAREGKSVAWCEKAWPELELNWFSVLSSCLDSANDTPKYIVRVRDARVLVVYRSLFGVPWFLLALVCDQILWASWNWKFTLTLWCLWYPRTGNFFGGEFMINFFSEIWKYSILRKLRLLVLRAKNRNYETHITVK